MKIFTTIGLVLLFILSTTSFRLSTHRCGGHLISWAVWGDAEPCMHSKADAPACPMHPKPAKSSKGCCDDHAETVTGLVPNTVVSTALEAPLAIASVIAILVDHFATTTNAGHGWSLVAHFRPPPLSGWAIHILERSILL
ncbi:MAG: hypothetical protein IPP83_10865 [Flavobacteriales bacterium]|nr:hypothetical protein [Flavobacteriales bacterium]